MKINMGSEQKDQFNLFNAFSTPFSLILMSFIGLNDEFPFDGIMVVFSVVNTDVN
jgi:hypothetical protein